MVMARKCDVCGSFYEEYGVKVDDYSSINAITLAYNEDDVAYYDLCPACMGHLIKWIANEGGI